MFARLQHLQLFLLVSLLGCGSSQIPPAKVIPLVPSSPTPVTPNITGITGNWDVGLQDSASSDTIYDFEGALTTQGPAVTGVFRINDPQHSPPCIPASEDIQFSGSVDSNDVLTLTSTPFSGSVATLKIQLPVSSGPIDFNTTSGEAQVVGTPCAVESAKILAQFVPSISGNYSGTMAPIQGQALTGPGGPATLSLTEGPANADGQFPVSGTLTFKSPLCTVSTTLSGIITGPFFKLNAGVSGMVFEGVHDGSPGTIFTASSSNIYVAPETPNCASGFYGGPLNVQ